MEKKSLCLCYLKKYIENDNKMKFTQKVLQKDKRRKAFGPKGFKKKCVFESWNYMYIPSLYT